MKQYMKNIMMAAVLLLTATGLRASNEVTIIKNGDGTATSKVEGSTCTLTVTPASDEYVTASNITAVKIVGGGMAQAPERRVPGVDNIPITVNAVDTDADPSGVTTYIFEMPGDGYDVEVTIDFQQRMDIANATVALSQNNCFYDGSPQTPTVTVTMDDTVLKESDFTVAYTNNVNVGTATVTLEGKRTYMGTTSAQFTISYFVYDLKVAGTSVSDENCQDVLGDGKVSFDPETNTLTLNGITATATSMSYIESEMETLNIALNGSNTINIAGEAMPVVKTTNYAATLAVQKASTDGLLTINNSESFAEGFASVNYDDDLKLQVLNGNCLVSSNLVTYGVTITPMEGQPVIVTVGNQVDVLGDGSVSFDGDTNLKLKQANLKGITLSSDYAKSELNIFLEGNSTIENNNVAAYAVKCEAASPVALALKTNPNSPGKMIYLNSSRTLGDYDEAFYGFGNCYLFSDLVAELSSVGLTLFVPLPPAVTDASGGDEESSATVINYGDASSAVNNEQLVNVSIQSVLYTLVDTQTPGANDDGFEEGHIDEEGVVADIVVINSTTTDDDVKNVSETVSSGNLNPGSTDFAENFKGLTFKLPKGEGNIFLKNVITDEQHALKVMIGTEISDDNPRSFTTNGKYEDYTLNYSVSEDCYVYIYVVELPNPAPAMMMASRRIGPKGTVSGGLGGLAISAKEIKVDVSKEVSSTVVANALAGNTVTVKDLTMKSIANGAFNSLLGKELAYIDLSATSITGVKVSRSEGAFKGISENTFIYMPVGNSSSEPNVVIGNTCANMQMDGNGNKPFKVAKNFTATKATLNRTFTKGKRSTIYLPYAIDQSTANSLGSFYSFTGISGTTVNMTKVTTGGLKANTPYIYVPGNGVSKVTVNAAAVKMEATKPINFVGTYEKLLWPVNQSNVYCFVGEEKGGFQIGMFARMGAGSWVPPFRAYMLKPAVSAPELDICWIENDDEQEVNGIKDVTVSADELKGRVTSGWYTVNGVKLEGMPAQKGLFIHNGKKVAK